MGCSICNHYISDLHLTTNLENIDISIKKQQIIVIIISDSSFESNKRQVNDHFEYEISKFDVLEQLKISAKHPKPDLIFKAISNSTHSFVFKDPCFYQFIQGDENILLKRPVKTELTDEVSLIEGGIYYLKGRFYINNMLYNGINSVNGIGFDYTNEMSSLSMVNNKDNVKFKKIGHSKGRFIKSKYTKPCFDDDNCSSSEKQFSKRRSLLNSMYTIKEVDSFNTSVYNQSHVGHY